MMMFRKTAGRFRIFRNASGVAAIEMALLLPIVLLIFFGMIDLTALIADARRVAYASNVAADMVTRLGSPTTPSAVGIAEKGVDLVMANGTTGPVRLEIHAYRRVSGAATTLWSQEYGSGELDCEEPAPSAVNSLMTQDNDVVVAVVCARHAPLVVNTMIGDLIGGASVTLQRQVTMRPRLDKTLECSAC